MAIIAGRRLDDLPAEDTARVTARRLERVGSVVCLRQAADLKTHSMRQRRVIDDVRICRDVLLERVLVGAVAMVDKRAARGGLNHCLRLRCRRASRYAGRAAAGSDGPIEVRIPLARRAVLARNKLGNRESQVGRWQT